MREVGLATTPDDVHDSLEELPASARLIYAILRRHDGLTRIEIEAATMVCERTVRRSLRLLRDEDLVWYGSHDAQTKSWHTSENEQRHPQNDR